jgi:hypothetical protein
VEWGFKPRTVNQIGAFQGASCSAKALDFSEEQWLPVSLSEPGIFLRCKLGLPAIAWESCRRQR